MVTSSDGPLFNRTIILLGEMLHMVCCCCCCWSNLTSGSQKWYRRIIWSVLFLCFYTILAEFTEAHTPHRKNTCSHIHSVTQSSTVHLSVASDISASCCPIFKISGTSNSIRLIWYNLCAAFFIRMFLIKVDSQSLFHIPLEFPATIFFNSISQNVHNHLQTSKFPKAVLNKVVASFLLIIKL